MEYLFGVALFLASYCELTSISPAVYDNYSNHMLLHHCAHSSQKYMPLLKYLKSLPNFISAARMASTKSKLVLNEIEGDLFSAPNTTSLAHCVGGDMGMGGGIAVKFKQVFGKVDELRSQNVSTGGVAVLKDDQRFIYYLVTKDYSYEKPTYDSLRSSLDAMRKHMVEHKVGQLAIPRIGCGIDGLEWDKVRNELETVFGPEEINITVYNFVPK